MNRCSPLPLTSPAPIRQISTDKPEGNLGACCFLDSTISALHVLQKIDSNRALMLNVTLPACSVAVLANSIYTRCFGRSFMIWNYGI